ncbi:hypothetical protein [Microbacterium bovistercoris]|nr:hypothetical protein [Microbacterium bovistercoris]
MERGPAACRDSSTRRMLRAELLGLTASEALALRHPHGEILRFE